MDSGRVPGLAPSVPDSYTRIRFGAWVRRARLAAVLGRPMPTKQTAPSRSARAAATVIISSAVQPLSSGISPHHVLRHPPDEGVAIPADRVPPLVEVVVPGRVPVRVRGMRAPGHGGDV